ncbi:MarR family transcriptional regulator [Blastococcus sp. TF02A-30]|nr:MarR family transcriptional regulator [Blastococcus sp. TF02A-30]
MHAARTQRRRWRDVLAPWGLSPSQARALRIVCERDSTRVSDLAEALRIAPRSATEVADDLEARGLVRRAPDPSDRRAVLLHVTPQGREIRDEVDAARSADSRVLFARLTADERAGLAELLRKVAEEP